MPSQILTASLTSQATDWLGNYGALGFYSLVFFLVFSGTGLFVGAFIPFITGDSLLFAAGLLAHNNDRLNIWVLAIGVGLSAFVGDQLGFILGRHYGRPYLDKRTGSWVHSAIAKSETFYQNLGWWAVVVARFIPWARVFVPAIAGISRMNYYKFLSGNFVGAVVWGIGLALTGYYSATIPAVNHAAYAIATFFIVGSVLAGLRIWWLNRTNISL